MASASYYTVYFGSNGSDKVLFVVPRLFPTVYSVTKSGADFVVTNDVGVAIVVQPSIEVTQPPPNYHSPQHVLQVT